jgi:thiol-disulfide isomerase/thioredoxin
MHLPSPRAVLRATGRYSLYFTAFFIISAVVNRFQAPKPGTKKIESLELTTLDGKPSTLKTAAGTTTVIYFFAPWCTVCKVSIDALNMFAGSDVQAVAVGLDYQSRGELAAFQNRLEAPVLAGSPDLGRRFSIDRYPTIYILNGDGSVAHTMVGYASRFGIWVRTKI